MTALATLTAARSALAAAIVGRDAADDPRRAFDKGLKPWVFTEFGETSQASKDFGFQPKTTEVPVATKALPSSRGVRREDGGRDRRATVCLLTMSTVCPATMTVCLLTMQRAACPGHPRDVRGQPPLL